MQKIPGYQEHFKSLINDLEYGKLCIPDWKIQYSILNVASAFKGRSGISVKARYYYL
jgi:hypothetical protein